MSDHSENEYADREIGESTKQSYELSHDTHADHGDTTVIFGRTLPFPLYTVVFLALGVMTLIEVLIGSLEGGVRIPVLLGLAAAKAYLVVYFYMHLKTDSRVFAMALAVPVVVALISMLFLLGVPRGSY